MRIDNLLQVTDGMLQNIPSVGHIESIKIDPLKVQRGDLFIDIKNSLQNQAVAYENGAYVIISENISQIIDNEIAWIEVDSLRLCAVKLARYEFSKKNGKILFLGDVEQEILHSIAKNSEFIKLSSNVYKTLITIKQSGENCNFTCSDERLAFSIDPSSAALKVCNGINIFMSNSPFFSSFVFDSVYYQDIAIPNIFVKKVCSVISFLSSNHIEYSLKNISLKKHFSPKFVDFKLQKREFGQSSKVLVFERDIDLIDLEIKYLQKFTNELLVCIPKKYSKYISFDNFISFVNNIDLIDTLRQNFRYALILGDKSLYKELFLPQASKQASLF